MEEIEYIRSNKGGQKIIYKGYMYTVHKMKKCGGIRWRCAQRSLNCKGSISTTTLGNPYLSIAHNHVPDSQLTDTARQKVFSQRPLDLHNVLDILVEEPLINSQYSVVLSRHIKMAETVLKKHRKSNFSQEEVETIVRAVSENYEALYGTFSKKATNKLARHHAWLEVTKEVNLVSNVKRTLNEVKNKWKKCQHLYHDYISYKCYNDDEDVYDESNVWEPLMEIENENEDSMPLEQRLHTPSTSGETPEPVLHSQPLSPTKLKVTRQAKPSPFINKPSSPSPPFLEEVSLKWNSHHSNMQSTLPTLLLREQYVDATLVAEGQTLKCHRVILSSCSPYFEEILSSISPYQHPVLFMKDIEFWILKALCDFMYTGEVRIVQNKLQELLNTAETLKIKGLAGQSEIKDEETDPEILDIPKLNKQEIDYEETDEIRKQDEKELKKRDNKEIKKKDEKDTKKTREEKRKEEREIKKECKKSSDPKRKEEKESKKKEEKDTKRKEEHIIKPMEIKQPKRKDEKDLKKKDEKDLKDKKRVQTPSPIPEFPIIKTAKSVKFPLQLTTEIPVLKSSKSRTYGASRRAEKKLLEKEKIVEKVPINKNLNDNHNFLDPFDLLEPVYEEVAKDPSLIRVPSKDPKNTNMRRTLQKKIKKRKLNEEREESPPPVLTRKGTRSRPNRKVPKFFHSTDPIEDQSPIVREPHTDQADPFMQMSIKSEPMYELEVEEDCIEIEDNLVGFSESSLSVEEQLLENFGSSSFSDYDQPCTRPAIQEIQPIIMDVQSIADKEEESSLNLINVAEIRVDKTDDPLEDPLTLNQTNIDSPVLIETVDNTLGFRITQVITEKDDNSRSSEVCREMGFEITNVISEQYVQRTEELEETNSVFTEIIQPNLEDFTKERSEQINKTDLTMLPSTSFQTETLQEPNKLDKHIDKIEDFEPMDTTERSEESNTPQILPNISCQGINDHSTATEQTQREVKHVENVNLPTVGSDTNTKPENDDNTYPCTDTAVPEFQENHTEPPQDDEVTEDINISNNPVSIDQFEEKKEYLNYQSTLDESYKDEIYPNNDCVVDNSSSITFGDGISIEKQSDSHRSEDTSLRIPNEELITSNQNSNIDISYVGEMKSSNTGTEFSENVSILNVQNDTPNEGCSGYENTLSKSNESNFNPFSNTNSEASNSNKPIPEGSNDNYLSHNSNSKVEKEDNCELTKTNLTNQINTNSSDTSNEQSISGILSSSGSYSEGNSEENFGAKVIPSEQYKNSNTAPLLCPDQVHLQNNVTIEPCNANEPGFHIAQVVSEQIAQIEGNRASVHYLNQPRPLHEGYNELESIVNDLSKIVDGTCEESTMDETNSDKSLENFTGK